MTDKDKYKAFRNFMFNELGITKEEIKDWIMEAVEQQVTAILKANRDTSLGVKAVVSREVSKELESWRYNGAREIRSEIAKGILDNLEVKVKG